MAAQQSVVITGGASGIGEACVRHFAALGWQVIIADRSLARGGEIAGELQASGRSARFSGLDVTSETAVEAFAESCFRETGGIAAVVNSAGILENAIRITDMPMREYDDIMAVNLRGTVLMGRAFGSRMCAQGAGSIIHLCSMTSTMPSAQPAYAVSKAGLKMLTEVMAAEFGPRGVRVNAVAPGYTLTPAMQERIDRKERDPARVIEKSALRRFVSPQEVASTIAFLCSEAASAITGVTLPVDCGWMAYASYSSYAATPPEQRA